MFLDTKVLWSDKVQIVENSCVNIYKHPQSKNERGVCITSKTDQLTDPTLAWNISWYARSTLTYLVSTVIPCLSTWFWKIIHSLKLVDYLHHLSSRSLFCLFLTGFAVYLTFFFNKCGYYFDLQIYDILYITNTFLNITFIVLLYRYFVRRFQIADMTFFHLYQL